MRFKFIIFILFISLFINFNYVNAEEIADCYNDSIVDTSDLFLVNYRAYFNGISTWFPSTVNGDRTLKYLFPVEPSKQYYLRFTKNSQTSSKIDYFYLYNENKKIIDSTSAFSGKNLSDYAVYSHENDVYKFLFNDNINFSYISFVFYPHPGDNFIFSTEDLSDLSKCPSVSPDVPIVDFENPTVSTTDQSLILSNFFDLFNAKLKFISDYAINNILFLAFISIIILFIILELFLFLYNRGGYKR